MASKRNQRKRGCECKRRYTQEEAHYIAWCMNKHHPGEARVMAYPCNFCRVWWHVGHNGAVAIHNLKWKGRR